jgi:3',5'-nucleoside bisphosphate phosphatase
VAVDLHTHSYYSDGSEAPAAVVDLAVAAGLSAIALTDHDGLGGVAEAADAADGRIEVIPGVELSTSWDGRSVHVLVYWPGTDTPLQRSLAVLKADRVRRNSEMVEALVGLGVDITVDDVAAVAGPGVAGRPHIARVLLDRGVVGSLSQAFDEYLAAGRPAYRGRLGLDTAEAVDLARRSGGVPVVAHPHTLADGPGASRGLFERISDMGFSGVECHYSEYDPDTRERLARWADDLGMVATGGSDYHGAYKRGIAVGSGRGDLHVPDGTVEALRERRIPC